MPFDWLKLLHAFTVSPSLFKNFLIMFLKLKQASFMNSVLPMRHSQNMKSALHSCQEISLSPPEFLNSNLRLSTYLLRDFRHLIILGLMFPSVFSGACISAHKCCAD